MRHAKVAIAIALLCVVAAAAQPVTFESPCECHDNHGEHRWSVKNDAETPATDAGAIHAVVFA